MGFEFEFEFDFIFTYLWSTLINTTFMLNRRINVTICLLGGRPSFNADISHPKGDLEATFYRLYLK